MRLFTYNHSIMGTEIEVIVAWVTDLAVNYCSRRNIIWWNIARAFSLEELGVVVLLGNDHCELGFPIFFNKLACLTPRK